MSEFIIAVIVISVVLFFIFKARKKSGEVQRDIPSHKPSVSETKPIVKPIVSNESVAKVEPAIKIEENTVVLVSPKAVTPTKATYRNIQIPQDSALRRHALSAIYTLLESCKENRPTDSTLSRHFDKSVEVKLSDYTDDADEILRLLNHYESQLKNVVMPVHAIIEDTMVSDKDVVTSTLPEDSTLRRHAIQLSS